MDLSFDNFLAQITAKIESMPDCEYKTKAKKYLEDIQQIPRDKWALKHSSYTFTIPIDQVPEWDEEKLKSFAFEQTKEYYKDGDTKLAKEYLSTLQSESFWSYECTTGYYHPFDGAGQDTTTWSFSPDSLSVTEVIEPSGIKRESPPQGCINLTQPRLHIFFDNNICRILDYFYQVKYFPKDLQLRIYKDTNKRITFNNSQLVHMTKEVTVQSSDTCFVGKRKKVTDVTISDNVATIEQREISTNNQLDILGEPKTAEYKVEQDASTITPDMLDEIEESIAHEWDSGGLFDDFFESSIVVEKEKKQKTSPFTKILNYAKSKIAKNKAKLINSQNTPLSAENDDRELIDD